MADFLRQLFQSPLPFDQKIQLIQENKNFKALYEQDTKYHDIYQAQINTLLSASGKRLQGFMLIEEYLQELPQHLLGDNLRNWAVICLSYIQSSSWNGKEVALELLDKLLKLGHHDDNTRKKLSLATISPFVEYVCRSSVILKKCQPRIVYSTLLTCVSKYPGSCGSKKNLIQSFILKNIHDNAADGFEVLVSIFANLHYCPTPGQMGSASKNAWFDQFCSVLVNLNSILNKLKSWGVSYNDLKLTNQTFDLYTSMEEDESLTGRLKVRQNFHFLALVVCRMLKDTNPLGLSIPVPSILNLIARACSINLGTLYKKDPSLSLVILSTQVDALKMLDQLILTCKTALAIHSKFIHQIMVRILDNSITAEKKSGDSDKSKMSLFELKDFCYQVLGNWFAIVGPNLYIEKIFIDSLLKHFMMDMKPSEKYIELRNIKKDNNPRRSSDSILSTPIIHDKLISLHRNCIRASNNFVRNCFINFTSEQLHFFSAFIAEEALTVYRYSVDVSYFYADPQTREQLLALILVLCLEGEALPLNVGLNIFRKALANENSSRLRNFCHDALRASNGLINPKRHLRVIEQTYEASNTRDIPMDHQQNEIGSSNEILPDQAKSGEEGEGVDQDECVIPKDVTSKEGETKDLKADESHNNDESFAIIENQIKRMNNGQDANNTAEDLMTDDDEEIILHDGDKQSSDSAKVSSPRLKEGLALDNDKEKDGNQGNKRGAQTNEKDMDDCIVFDSDDELEGSVIETDEIEIVGIKNSSPKSSDTPLHGSPSVKRQKVTEEALSSKSLTIIERADEQEITDDEEDVIKEFVPS